ncbi:MAG: GNAT family N-acetyltransferase [Bacteroidales bacterium]|nr:GNAT family N-acetyltransferase [Bacteroidales bacterium]
MRNIILRALEPSDIDTLYLWENTPEMWQYGVSQAPISRHQLWEYIRSYSANPLSEGQLRLMIASGNEKIGTVDLYDIDSRHGRAFVGIMIAPEYRRKGYGRAALSFLTEYCRDTLSLRLLAATIAETNNASLNLFKASGFTPEASLPGWIKETGNRYVAARIFIKEL